jgi:hypothetical protein
LWEPRGCVLSALGEFTGRESKLPDMLGFGSCRPQAVKARSRDNGAAGGYLDGDGDNAWKRHNLQAWSHRRLRTASRRGGSRPLLPLRFANGSPTTGDADQRSGNGSQAPV